MTFVNSFLISHALCKGDMRGNVVEHVVNIIPQPAATVMIQLRGKFAAVSEAQRSWVCCWFLVSSVE